MELTYTEENYLKAIWSISRGNQQGASTNQLADKLETKASSVTDMVRRLSDKELVHYVKYRGVSLSEKGRLVAIRIIRKHRLWECFLADTLGFNWDEVHELAEQLEHIRSTELTEKLDEFLGFPSFDPHGDPIPNKEGRFPERERKRLMECESGDVVVLTGVSDSSASFLQFLDKLNLKLGSKMTVVESAEFDKSFWVKRGEQEQLLPAAVVQQLLVTKEHKM